MADSPGSVLIWDFDGTLGERPERWSGAVRDALTEVLGPHEFSRAQISGVLRQGYPWHEPERPHPQLAAADDWWRHLAAVQSGALRQLGLDSDQAAAAAGLVRSHYCAATGWRLFGDTLPALTRLTELGWRHVVLSNHVPELEEILGRLGLGGQFAAVVNSAVTGYEKPHPEAFRRALTAAGQPAIAWMIGDNPAADIAGAARAGLPGILVRTPPGDGRPPVTDLTTLTSLLPPASS